MYQVFLVVGTDQTFLAQFQLLASAQDYIFGLDQSQLYSVIYKDAETGDITIIQ